MREISDIKAIISTGDYTFEFTDSVDTDALTARLINEGTHIRLEVTPKYELGFELLQICFNVQMSKNDRAFLNGYQSWTDSREYEMHEKMRGIDHLPKAVVRKFALDKYGDYNFAVYSKKTGDFHGFSYGYLREGEEFTLFGSLNERDGFTLIETSYDKKLVCFSKDCEGKVYSDTFTALDVSVMTGSENDVFDRFFELSGIKCRQAAPLSGYTSWYRHYQDISEEKLLHDLEGIAANKERYDIFQIDDGFQKGVGDWLKTDAGKFPHGMKYISDRIHGQGLMSGLWLAPFVCEKNSYIYRHRQDMLLKDENGEPVAAFVFRVTGVSLHPVEGDLVLFEQREEPLPQVNIQRRLFVGLYPAFFLPAIHPTLCNAVNDVFAVSCENYAAGFLEGSETGYHTEQLHTVIGGGAFAAGEFLFDVSEPEHNAVAAGTGVAAARAVGEYLNSFDTKPSSGDRHLTIIHSTLLL